MERVVSSLVFGAERENVEDWRGKQVRCRCRSKLKPKAVGVGSLAL